VSNSPNLQLPFLDANQNQKHVTHNAALSTLDALVNCAVLSTAFTAPPVSPGDGQCWIIGAGATGAWAGKDLQLAAWQDGAWTFFVPRTGFTAFAIDVGSLLAWNGSTWSAAVPAGGSGSTGSTSFVQALIFG
jgi:hypothetical protein